MKNKDLLLEFDSLDLDKKEHVLQNLLGTIELWQRNYNKLSDDMSEITGKTYFKVLIEDDNTYFSSLLDYAKYKDYE